MSRIVSIGNQDFRSIREQGCFYIDKSDFIREWWENRDVVTLITRPRRFGKTLTLSMTDCFFSIENANRADIFEGLNIWSQKELRSLQGSFPVIYISFADIKAAAFPDARAAIIQKILRLFSAHSYIKAADILRQEDREYLNSLTVNMSDAAAAVSINVLSDLLQRYYNKKVIILLDEYDTPLQEAYLNGYWTEMTAFIRSLFNSTFKTNPYLERGLLTGITRVSKESIFSDLNNLEVVTTTSSKYQSSFGFTEDEVSAALAEFGLSDQAMKVQHWYNGFRFGNRDDIYNPWSITKFLDSGQFSGYWANTSSNALAGQLIREGSADMKTKMETLLEGGDIFTPVEEELSFDQLDVQENAVWSLLLASGYLKIKEPAAEGDDRCLLTLTNYEVCSMFRKMIRSWFSGPSAHYNDFVQALLKNDVTYMNRFMNQMTQSVFSYFDTQKGTSGQEPERFYHGFVLGLLADADLDYVISSNRESGFGRYDVMLEPRHSKDCAYVLEFKVHDPERENSPEETVRAALKQIEEKNYDAAFCARGISPEQIRHYGFAFEGKNVLIG